MSWGPGLLGFLAGSGLSRVRGELDSLPPLPLVALWPHFCGFQGLCLQAPMGLPIPGSAYRRGLMHVSAPHSAIFIEIGTPVLTWAGL